MRLFVALDLPAGVRATLAAWADAAAPSGIRRVPQENLHVTLAFLGSRSEDDAAAVGALLQQVARPLGVLRSTGALWLAPRRPRVLTVALAAHAGLSALQADLVAELRTAIGFKAGARPFRPHVTVGRVPQGMRIDTRRTLEPPLPELSIEPTGLSLYRSHTGAGGARYEPLARAGLDS